MATTQERFLNRLRLGRSLDCIYHSGELTGLISVWVYDGAYVLTWEECKVGDQYNEHAYTRDERHRFGTAEEVLAFVERGGHPASTFTW